jgi:hypothetical protein
MSLLSRFDDRALRVEPLHRLDASTAVPAPALRDWCLAGLDRGRARRVPPNCPLALGLVADDSPWTSAGLEALCRELDGDRLLRALPGAAARWQLKLRVKAQDLAGWRPRRADDIWDSGYLAATADVLAVLPGFRPRRPTLMVADPMPLAALQARLAALAAAAPRFAHPVRVIAVLPPTEAARWRAADWAGLLPQCWDIAGPQSPHAALARFHP